MMRSALPGQGGDTKLMALHMLSGGKRTKRCPLLRAPRRGKLPIHESSLNATMSKLPEIASPGVSAKPSISSSTQGRRRSPSSRP